MRKEAYPDWEIQTKKQLKAFETVKEKMKSLPVLALPRADKTYMLNTDPSAYQLGCTLVQEQDDDT